MQPEIAGLTSARVHHSTKVDVYAFGVIMWELMTTQIPWDQKSQREIFTAVRAEQRPPISPEDRLFAPKGFIELMQLCWHQNPLARPEFSEILLKLDDIFRLKGWTPISDATEHRGSAGLARLSSSSNSTPPSRTSSTQSSKHPTKDLSRYQQFDDPA
jgi:serine/threonine protein kinase